MALNQVQVDFVNEVARPHFEAMVKMIDGLDIFIADYDAIQGSADALPEDATVLDDNADGTAPRADAPQLTGLLVKQLRNFSNTMSGTVNAAQKDILIAAMVRGLATVLRG